MTGVGRRGAGLGRAGALGTADRLAAVAGVGFSIVLVRVAVARTRCGAAGPGGIGARLAGAHTVGVTEIGFGLTGVGFGFAGVVVAAGGVGSDLAENRGSAGAGAGVAVGAICTGGARGTQHAPVTAGTAYTALATGTADNAGPAVAASTAVTTRTANPDRPQTGPSEQQRSAAAFTPGTTGTTGLTVGSCCRGVGAVRTGPAGPAGPAGTPNGYTKTEADAAFLGKTAKADDADKLDGIDSSGFVQGGGVQDDSFVSLSANGTSDPFLKIPGLGRLTASCSAGTLPTVTYVNDSGGTTNYTSSRFSTSGNVFQQNTLADAGTFSSGTAEGLWILQIQKGTLFAGSSRATVMISLGVLNSKCRIQAQLQGSSSAGFILNLPPVILP